jgi:hypothetical protein
MGVKGIRIKKIREIQARDVVDILVHYPNDKGVIEPVNEIKRDV